jgi:hypothetical protein
LKIVCDEGVPRALARRLRALGLDISPPDTEWRGLSNGKLAATAAKAGFDVLLSNDKNMIFQLNLAMIEIAIVTIPTNRRHSIVPRSEDIADTLRRASPRQHISIELDGRRTVRRWGAEGATIADAMTPVAPFET